MQAPRLTTSYARPVEGVARLIALLPALGVATRDVARSRRLATLAGELTVASLHLHADQHAYDPDPLTGQAIDTYRRLRDLPVVIRLTALGEAAGDVALQLAEGDPAAAAAALADLAAAAIALDPAAAP